MKNKIKEYIKTWENKCYYFGIPDEIPQKLSETKRVPNYKDIVKCIIKNDNHLEGLGFTKQKCNAYNVLKKIELYERGVIKKDLQLKLL